MRRMIKANIMGNAYDLSEKLQAEQQAAQAYFGKLNQNADAIKPDRLPLSKTGKKTLQLVEGSRRKRANLIQSKEKDKENPDAPSLPAIPKRIRPAGGRRIGGSGVAKVFRCHLDSCGKIFSDRASLKKHMTVHGDKLVSTSTNSLIP